MPVVDRTPDTLRPFAFHGVVFIRDDGDEATAESCPFCGKSGGKFGVKVTTGQYHCFSCGEDGNAATFLRRLYEISTCLGSEAVELARDRGFLDQRTIPAWGLVCSALNGDWLVPGHGIGGKVDQLYRYSQWDGDPKRRLRGTSGVDLTLIGLPLFDPDKPTVYVCETWNAPALWEALRTTKRGDDGTLTLTAAEDRSILAESNVLGVPGANVWKERWSPLLAGKRVVLVVDNDHPREITTKSGKKIVDGAGLAGARRTARMLASSAEPPESIHFVNWGAAAGGDDRYDPDRPSGFDARDLLVEEDSPRGRVRKLGELLALVRPIPEEWVGGRSGDAVSRGSPHLQPKRCESWRELVQVWRRAMKWTADLEHLLSVCLAAVVSTETRGEQLWVLVMAPPSSGKTTICEALAVARDYVHPRSMLNKVYSGFKIDKDGGEDFGIIPHILNKTLVVKDGDTLLKDPNRGMILSQYRDLFDGVGRSQYNNGTSRSYDRVRFTFILAGTASMREMDASEVGARFINCSFAERIDPEHERDVNRRVAFREFRNVKSMVNGSAETFADADMTAAKQLTGGYVEFLRQNAERLLGKVEADEADLERIITFGEFVAHMRARVPKHQDEVVEREFSSRLVAQFVRLATCLTAVLGKTDMDDEVVARVRRTALDTARGRVFNIARSLFRAGREHGESVSGVALAVGEGEDKVRTTLSFLSRIEVAERFTEKRPDGTLGRARWRLTARMNRLYSEVVNDAEG